MWRSSRRIAFDLPDDLTIDLREFAVREGPLPSLSN